MNKGELVEQVAAAADLEKRKHVALFSVGAFATTSRAARVGRDTTGAPVNIAASKGVKFSSAIAYEKSFGEEGGQVGQVHQEALAKGGTE